MRVGPWHTFSVFDYRDNPVYNCRKRLNFARPPSEYVVLRLKLNQGLINPLQMIRRLPNVRIEAAIKPSQRLHTFLMSTIL